MARNVKLTATTGIAVLGGPDREDIPRQQTVISTAAETPISPAGDPDSYYDLYSLRIANSSATAVVVDIRNAVAGPVQDSYTVGAGQTVGFHGPPDASLPGSAKNSQWTAKTSAGVANVIVSAFFVKRGG